MKCDSEVGRRKALMAISHRLFSLLLMVSLVVLGFYAIAISSVQSAVLYFLFCIMCIAIILYLFCSKCPCRAAGCAHFLFGPVADKLFSRKQGPYSRTDIILTGAGFLGIILFPQYWLLSEHTLLAIYWVCVALTFWEVKAYVCKVCGNELCPAHKKHVPPS